MHVLLKIFPSPGFQNSFLSSCFLADCFSLGSFALLLAFSSVHPQELTPVTFLYWHLLPGWIHRSRTSAELRSHVSNWLFDISIWICNRLPKFSMSKIEFLICMLPTSTNGIHSHSPILCGRYLHLPVSQAKMLRYSWLPSVPTTKLSIDYFSSFFDIWLEQSDHHEYNFHSDDPFPIHHKSSLGLLQLFLVIPVTDPASL